tara:strand:+ start:16 stop:639 length:624 start_codon:yes stop_codon:yes gene_type:complete
MARKADAEEDRQAKQVLEQINSKQVRRPLASTGLTGDRVPTTVLTLADYDTILNNIDTKVDNIEALNALKLVGDMAGFTPYGGALRGSLQTFQVNGVNNATTYLDFGPGVWQISEVSVYYTGGSGTPAFRLFAYDPQSSDGPLEFVYATTSSTNFYNFNLDAQFDHFASLYFGETNLPGGSRQLGFKPSGTFDAGSMTAFVLCHRVV